MVGINESGQHWHDVYETAREIGNAIKDNPDFVRDRPEIWNALKESLIMSTLAARQTTWVNMVRNTVDECERDANARRKTSMTDRLSRLMLAYTDLGIEQMTRYDTKNSDRLVNATILNMLDDSEAKFVNGKRANARETVCQLKDQLTREFDAMGASDLERTKAYAHMNTLLEGLEGDRNDEAQETVRRVTARRVRQLRRSAEAMLATGMTPGIDCGLRHALELEASTSKITDSTFEMIAELAREDGSFAKREPSITNAQLLADTIASPNNPTDLPAIRAMRAAKIRDKLDKLKVMTDAQGRRRQPQAYIGRDIQHTPSR